MLSTSAKAWKSAIVAFLLCQTHRPRVQPVLAIVNEGFSLNDLRLTNLKDKVDVSFGLLYQSYLFF